MSKLPPMKTHRDQINEILEKYAELRRVHNFDKNETINNLMDEIIDIDACVNMED